MKILLLNGSPRRGNTYTALEVLKRSFANIPNAEVSQIDTNKVEVASCIACEYCKKHGKCFVKDDTNAVIDAIVSADVLIFATPVYWWGISSQLKAIIDKFSPADAPYTKEEIRFNCQWPTFYRQCPVRHNIEAI